MPLEARLLLLLHFAATVTAAQIERLPPRFIESDSASATCYAEQTGKLVGSQRVRSHTLVSFTGQRAFTMNQAIASRLSGSEEWVCDNTAHLFISNGEAARYREVLTVSATPQMRGNHISLIDWSPDGRWLLFTESEFQWGSDVGESDVRLYDTRTGLLSEHHLLPNVLSTHAGRKCIGNFEAQGFSTHGEVVIAVSPFFSIGEEEPEKDSCVRKKETWLFDSASHVLRLLSGECAVRRYARIEAGNVK